MVPILDTLLIIDDDSKRRDHMIQMLSICGFKAFPAHSGQNALERINSQCFDLVLLKSEMPEMSGMEALRQIRSMLPDVKVVMLTVSEDDSDLFEAIRSGASGYLLKNLNADDFLEMLKGLSQGEAVMTRETTARLMRGFADLADLQEASPDRLSPRELELLQLVAEGLSNKAIGQRLSVSVNTVKYHMKNILQKLGAQNRTEAVMMAIRSGLIKPEHSD